MTKQELKAQISQLLEMMPEDQLDEVLAYVKQVSKMSLASTNRSSSLIKIMREDREVLQKLAK